MHADESNAQRIFYGNASTWLAQLEAGENAWDSTIVWVYEGKWQAVLDHLLAQGKLNVLMRQEGGEAFEYEQTDDPQNAWIAESDLRQIFANPPREVMEKFELRRQEAAAQAARRQEAKTAAGRYTLQEAAELLAANAGGQAKRWLRKLKGAVEAGEVTVYQPGETDTYRPKTVREFWEEAYGSDLNTWLDANERRTDWRFPPAYSPEFIKLRHDQAEAASRGSSQPGRGRPRGRRRRRAIAGCMACSMRALVVVRDAQQQHRSSHRRTQGCCIGRVSHWDISIASSTSKRNQLSRLPPARTAIMRIVSLRVFEPNHVAYRWNVHCRRSAFDPRSVCCPAAGAGHGSSACPLNPRVCSGD